MNPEQILLDRQGVVLVITLNRPERLNAWTRRMMNEMTTAIVAANEDPAIGAIVVTGAGRGFCAGADIGGNFAAPPAAGGSEQPPRPEERLTDWVKLCRSSKPLIAAINGPAIGIGVSMVLPFDRIVAATSAKMSMRFVRMGIVPELASTRFLVARCGWGPASWLALSGDTILADEAARLGLVDRVVADGDAVTAALADAAVLAANPPLAMRVVKDLLTQNANETDTDVIQQRELAALDIAFTTAEHREAVSAFLEKRAPNFTGL